jgi:hypothetical protein
MDTDVQGSSSMQENVLYHSTHGANERSKRASSNDGRKHDPLLSPDLNPPHAAGTPRHSWTAPVYRQYTLRCCPSPFPFNLASALRRARPTFASTSRQHRQRRYRVARRTQAWSHIAQGAAETES